LNEIKIFTNENFGEVGAVELEGNTWFIARDVCRALELDNSRQALSRLDEDEKNTVILNDGNRGNPNMAIINESGLYSLALSSRKPEAKAFKRWITHEVLPSIRKHGMYAMDELLDNPDIAIEALTRLKEEREKRKELEFENKVQAQQIAELQPKATYYDLVLQNPDLISTSLIAKDYGLSGKALNKILHELGIQFNQGGVWLLYAKYQDKGYTSTKTTVFPRTDGTQGLSILTKWTQKGRLFLYDILKANGYIPLVERG
jgi:prophage antirepressor